MFIGIYNKKEAFDIVVFFDKEIFYKQEIDWKMYYIWSFVVCTLLFSAIQYNEYTKDIQHYRLITMMNFATFLIMYLIMTIVFYMMFEIDYKCLNKIQKGGKSATTNPISADPVMLRKINENVYTGFSPNDISDM